MGEGTWGRCKETPVKSNSTDSDLVMELTGHPSTRMRGHFKHNYVGQIRPEEGDGLQTSPGAGLLGA